MLIDPADLPQATKAPAIFPWEALRTELVNLGSTPDAAARMPTDEKA